MHDFFNDNTKDQHDHDHDHDTAGSDVNADDSIHSNSESTHDDDRNLHKEGKEPKAMNQIIKNSSAPIITAFTAAMMIILCFAASAAGFDSIKFRGDVLNNDIDLFDLRSDRLDTDQADLSYRDDGIVRFDQDGIVDSDGQDFDRNGDVDRVDFQEDKFVDNDGDDIARSDPGPIYDPADDLAQADPTRDADNYLASIDPLYGPDRRLDSFDPIYDGDGRRDGFDPTFDVTDTFTYLDPQDYLGVDAWDLISLDGDPFVSFDGSDAVDPDRFFSVDDYYGDDLSCDNLNGMDLVG